MVGIGIIYIPAAKGQEPICEAFNLERMRQHLEILHSKSRNHDYFVSPGGRPYVLITETIGMKIRK